MSERRGQASTRWRASGTASSGVQPDLLSSDDVSTCTITFVHTQTQYLQMNFLSLIKVFCRRLEFEGLSCVFFCTWVRCDFCCICTCVCMCGSSDTAYTHTHTNMSTHRNITYTQNILDIRIYIHTYAFKPEEESHGLRPRRPSVERLLS